MTPRHSRNLQSESICIKNHDGPRLKDCRVTSKGDRTIRDKGMIEEAFRNEDQRVAEERFEKEPQSL